jgi:hypothetical protein
MNEQKQTPEELIAGMAPDEICELLEEIGIEVDRDEASSIQRLIADLGSLDAALQAFGGEDDAQKNAA